MTTTLYKRLEPEWIKPNEDDETEFLVRPLTSPQVIDLENEIDVDENRI